jgi:hypothetical protein
MRKPEGPAKAGWFDHPSEEGQEKYWNGKFWSTETRRIGKAGPEVLAINEKYLGGFLFRNPIARDGAFFAYLILSLFAVGSIFIQEISSTSLSLALITLIPAAIVTFGWVYLLFLIFLVPRRFFDRKRGLTKREFTERKKPSKILNRKSTKILLVILGVLFVGASSFRLDSFFGPSKAEKWFEVQQGISRVIGDWNVAATPISEAIGQITSGEMSSQEARRIISDTSSEFALIHNRLFNECLKIPSYDINAAGEDGAIGKLYYALQANCDFLPQQSAEVLLLVSEQISPTGTQAKIDYHVQQIQELGGKRRDALLAGIEGMQPYLNSVEKETLKRLTDSL